MSDTPPELQAAPKSVGWARRLAKSPWRLIGLVLLVIVLLNIDLKRVWEQMRQIGPLSALCTAGAFFLLITGRCWRWWELTQAVGARMGPRETVASCNRSIWLGLATPGRIGEFRRALDLSAATGWGLPASGGLVLFDLLIDLGAFVTMGIGGLLYLVLPAPWGVVAGGGMVAAAVIVLLNLAFLAGQAAKIAPVLLKVPGFAQVLPAVHRGLRGGSVVRMSLGLLLTVTAHVLSVWFLVVPMQPDIRLIDVAAGAGLAGIAGAIPITYFGLGTRDVMLLWFFAQIGRPAADAVALSLSFIPVMLIGIVVSLATGVLIDLGTGRAADRPAR